MYSVGTHILCGIALGIIGLSLEKRIIGTNFSADVTIVHVTSYCHVLSQCASCAKRGGDMDEPTSSSSSTKAIQARGESSSVQELDPRTYPSILDKLQAPRLSDLGRSDAYMLTRHQLGRSDPV